MPSGLAPGEVAAARERVQMSLSSRSLWLAAFDGLPGVGLVVEAVLADGGVFAEVLTERGLGVGGKEIEAEVGGDDGIGLFDDDLAVIVVTGDRS